MGSTERRQPNYFFKSIILTEYNDLITAIRQTRQYEFALLDLNENGVVRYSIKHPPKYESMSELTCVCSDNSLTEHLLEGCRIVHATESRTCRLKKRIKSMLTSGPCVFLTLTFTDTTLNNTTPKQRRNRVSRYLKMYKTRYIANIDFGSNNHREHYHAIIQCDRVDSKFWREDQKNGSLNFEKIRIEEAATTKLSKYVAKLGNHAIKETTKRSALIYSR